LSVHAIRNIPANTTITVYGGKVPRSTPSTSHTHIVVGGNQPVLLDGKDCADFIRQYFIFDDNGQWDKNATAALLSTYSPEIINTVIRIMSDGFGFVINHPDKYENRNARYNRKRWFRKLKYTSGSPCTDCVIQIDTTRDIDAGEEIVAMYNNKESRSHAYSPVAEPTADSFSSSSSVVEITTDMQPIQIPTNLQPIQPSIHLQPRVRTCNVNTNTQCV
jgi:hypothetical protein